MALDERKTAEVIETMKRFLDKRRPPENIHHQIDLDYKIDNQSVIIFEIRAHWKNSDIKIEEPVAKTTWVETQKVWKIYWMRADLKWHSYQPKFKVKTIAAFTKIVDEDKYGCFWG